MKSYILYFSLFIVATAYPLIDDASSNLSPTDALESKLDGLKKAVYHLPTEVKQVNDVFIKEVQHFINASILSIKEMNEGFDISKRKNIDQPLEFVITALTKNQQTQGYIPNVQTMKKNADDYMDEIVKKNGHYAKLLELFEAANQELVRVTDEIKKVQMQPLN